MGEDGDRRFRSNLPYRLVVFAQFAFPLGVVALAIPRVGWLVAAAWVTAVAIRASMTGVRIDTDSVVVRNFASTTRVRYANVGSIGLEEVGPGRIGWRMSRSMVIRIETASGRVVRSYCLTEGPRLVPAPNPSVLSEIVGEVSRRLPVRT